MTTILLLVIAISLVMLTWDKWRALLMVIPVLSTIAGALIGGLVLWSFVNDLNNNNLMTTLISYVWIMAVGSVLLCVQPVSNLLTGYNPDYARESAFLTSLGYNLEHEHEYLGSVWHKTLWWGWCLVTMVLLTIAVIYIFGPLLSQGVKHILGYHAELWKDRKDLLWFWVLVLMGEFAFPLCLEAGLISPWRHKQFMKRFLKKRPSGAWPDNEAKDEAE